MMVTYALSSSQAKAADRVGGIDLILPWPDDLPHGPPMRVDEERDATDDERGAAEAMIGPSARAHGVLPVRTYVACLRRPFSLPRGSQIEPHLVVVLIGYRWVHATGQRGRPVHRRWYRA